MIRFLNLQDQIIEGRDDFAFYDTVFGKVVTLNNENTWDRLEDFEYDFKEEYKEETLRSRPLNRFTDKIPTNYFRGLLLVEEEG